MENVKNLENKKYLLGLDIGSNSVGWCLTDENYDIIKKGGKAFWGVRMFEEANDARKRRGFRTLRRNLNRRNERLRLLQELFAEEMNHVDPTFFKRLSESFYHQEDRELKNKYTLFPEGWTDSDYYKAYPTIYHVRKALIEKQEKADLRILYLAISQMYKKRGHFLNDTEEFHVSDKNNFQQLIFDFQTNINEFLENLIGSDVDHLNFSMEEGYQKMHHIYHDVKGVKEKKKALEQYFETKNSFMKNFIIPFLVGSTVDLKKEDSFELLEKLEISVDLEDLEDRLNEFMQKTDQIALVEAFRTGKKIYDFFFLEKLLSGSTYLYEAMVKRYEQHQADLTLLKEFVKKFRPEKYQECFKIVDDKIANYAHYVGLNFIRNKPQRFQKAKRGDFYKYLNSNILKGYEETEESKRIAQDILEKMNNQEFLLKLSTSENSVFPYQLNLKELQEILENQKQFYPFLTATDQDGISVIEKLEMILKHRIPYYVGVLNRKSNYAWVVRSNEKIYPWNFDKVVDLDKSAEEFIRRMQNKCTYLKDQFCLPKNSIIFSRYNVYSFLNKVSLNGIPITGAQKEAVFQNVFLQYRKPTKKNLLEYFKSVYGLNVEVRTSTGKELENITCDMASYYDFKKIYSAAFVEENMDAIEHLIVDIVIFKDKKILANRIQKEPKYKIFRNEISKIKGLNYDKFSSLSEKLLVDIKHQDGEHAELGISILELMEHTNLNLQEILFHSDYQFQEKVRLYNEEHAKSHASVEKFIEEEIYVSPVMKRPLLQAYKIIEEVEKRLGVKIDEYYVECTRSNTQEKARTKSRKTAALDLLQSAKQFAREQTAVAISESEINALIDQCQKKEENEFRSDKLYLYFTQLGKCMYTLEPISFADLNNDSLYDIDHIVPQSICKDDSFSNRVLIKTEVNKLKSNEYPIPAELLNKNCNGFYKMLFEKGLISPKKFMNLTRREISANDLQGFINRQLVVTNQAVKGLIEVLQRYKGVEQKNVIFSKAENVSAIRQRYGIVKSRHANNFHHAHDAYLNIVAGRAVHKYFSRYETRNLEEIREYNRKGITTNAEVLFEFDYKNPYPNFRQYWSVEILEKVRKNIFERYDILTTTRVHCPNELLSKVTIKPKSDKDSLIPVKTTHPILSKTEKYGGVTDEKFSSYDLVKYHDKKGKEVVQLIAIPTSAANNKAEYILEIVQFPYQTILEKLKVNTVILRDKKKFVITGKTGGQFLIKNLYERFFPKDTMVIIQKLEKYHRQLSSKIEMKSNQEQIVVSESKSKKNHAVILGAEELLILFEEIRKVYSKPIYNYSNIININEVLSVQGFQGLSMKEQAKCLLEMLNLLKCNERKTADLQELGLAKTSGLLRISNKLEKGDKIVFEGVTGLYSKVVWEYK